MKLQYPRHKVVYRTVGGSGSMENYNVGFMDKSGKKEDHVDYNPRFYSVVYVLKGRGLYVDPHGNRYPLKEGSIFQRFPSMRHSTYIRSDEWNECFIQAGSRMFETLKAMRVAREDRFTGFIGINRPLIARFAGAMDRLESSEEENLPKVVVELLDIMTDVFALAYGGGDDDRIRSMVDSACRYLEADPDGNADIRKFCKDNGWGYEFFRKKFKEQTGIPPGRYRIRRLVNRSCKILNHSELQVSEIAEQLGYKSVYEFSAQFKKYTGLSPNAYRKGRG